VARGARRREALELANGRTFVAIFALHRGVSTEQRETILVIFHLLDSNIPSLNGVALSAIRAHFPLVNIGVTILTILACVDEHGLDMALRALHFFVHAAKGILGLVVVEFRDCADGAPTRGGVAVFTRNCEGTVRTSSGLSLRSRKVNICWLPN
jgi:hypothetical protein